MKTAKDAVAFGGALVTLIVLVALALGVVALALVFLWFAIVEEAGVWVKAIGSIVVVVAASATWHQIRAHASEQ